MCYENQSLFRAVRVNIFFTSVSIIISNFIRFCLILWHYLDKTMVMRIAMNPRIVRLTAGIDEFKGYWRGLKPFSFLEITLSVNPLLREYHDRKSVWGGQSRWGRELVLRAVLQRPKRDQPSFPASLSLSRACGANGQCHHAASN